MYSLLLLKAICFLILLLIGIPGNVFILLQFTYIKISEKKLLPTNIILMMLALVNFLVILSRIIPQFLNSIGVENLLNDTECKLVIYTYRVSRAMSICITSFLSCYQCILIAPTNRFWNYLKQRATQNVVVIILLFWSMNFCIYPYSILNARTRRNITTSPYTLHLVYCDADFLNYKAYVIHGSIVSLRDFIFVGLMSLASIYIVCVLIIHERAIKGIRSSERTKKRSAEYKASRAVILLVALYVVLFGLDNSMWVYTLTLSNVSPDINDIRIFLASAYSTLSPIVIIVTNPKLQKSLKWSYRKKPLLLACYDGSATNGNLYSLSKEIS
ncbi:olfactory receptor class A-like protein 1 [Discoglossus pictus]